MYLIDAENVSVMSRACCNVCLRAKPACICHLFTQIDNETHVVILQHPSEVKQTKGSVTLLANSLTHCTVFVGEDFNQHEALHRTLALHKERVALLYPSESATLLTEKNTNNSAILTAPTCIVLIDATWKKSYKMYMINHFLHGFNHLALPDSILCDYRIRKTKKAQALSSLEACTHALIRLESDTNKYQKLLNSFSLFNDFQLSFRPQ